MGWFDNPRDTRQFASSREEQKTSIINSLSSKLRTPKIQQNLDNGYTPTEIIDNYATSNPDKADAITKNRNAGYSDEELLHSLASNDDKIQKQILHTKYDINLSGDSRVDDLALGIRKSLGGIDRTFDDISHYLGKKTGLSIFMSDKEYEAQGKEHKEKQKVLEDAIKDKDFLSTGTLGKMAPAIVTLPVSSQSVLLVSALEAANGYAIERGESKSTVGSAATAGAISGVTAGVLTGAAKLIDYANGGSAKKAYDTYMKDSKLSKEDADNMLEEFYNTTEPSGSIYKDRLKAVVNANTTDKNIALDSVNSIIDSGVQQEKVSNSLFTEATDRLNELKSAGSDALPYDKVAKRVEGIGTAVKKRYEDLYNEIADTGSPAHVNTNIIAFNKAKSESADKLSSLTDDIHSTEQAVIDAPNKQAKVAMQRHLKQLRLDKKVMTKAHKEDLDKLEVLANSEAKLADLNIDNLDTYVQSAGTTVKDILKQETINNADAMEAVKSINDILRSSSGNKLGKKYGLHQVKDVLQEKLQANLPTSQWDKWEKVQKDYADYSVIRQSKLGKAIHGLTLPKSSGKRISVEEFISDLPKYLDDNDYDVFGAISRIGSKRQASIVERKIIGSVMDTDIQSFSPFTWEKLRKVIKRSNFRTPEGRAFKSMSSSIAKSFKNDAKYKTTVLSDSGETHTGQSKVLNLLSNQFIIRHLLGVLRHGTKQGRFEHRLSAVLREPSTVKKFDSYVKTLGDGQRAKILDDMYQKLPSYFIPKLGGVTVGTQLVGGE